jgi:hypothetical protein
VEIDAVGTDAQRLWETLAPLPGQPADLHGDPTVTFAGSSGSDAVAVVGDNDDNYRSIAFNLANHDVLWQNTKFLAGTVVGDTVVGTTDPSQPFRLGTHEDLGPLSNTLYVSGVSLQTGRAVWQQSESVSDASIQRGGPDTVLVEDQNSYDSEAISLVHVSTGKEQALTGEQASLGGGGLWTCQFDGQATVVCADDTVQSDSVIAFDGSTGQELWQLPGQSENRVAPAITVAYEGKVYGKVLPNGPVVLDARTGNYVNDSPGVAPVLVDPDVGIAANKDGQLEAYPVTR